jgi:hypothetical protein
VRDPSKEQQPKLGHAVQIKPSLQPLPPKKGEYFKDPPETIGDFSPEAVEFGARRPVANLQKPAICGHFWHC